ncbi:MAG: gluconeogenesis factor YvcK family protein [Acidobacteriota bacterium]
MRRMLSRVVVMGGGTGTYVVLTGLKKYPIDLTAVVSMADSGGSTGALRTELGILPPGSVRPALIALSGSPQLMRDLFTYRFPKGKLKGHVLGNLLLAGLVGVTGDFTEALKEAAQILAIRGKVVPVTTTDAHLVATLKNGRRIHGEGRIDARGKGDPISSVALQPAARATRDALQAIQQADLVVIGPGDLYTSIVPNLLVKGIPEALRRARATVVYVVNVMTKPGETDGFTVRTFVSEMERYVGRGVIDVVIVNTGRPSASLLRRYRRQDQDLVTFSRDEVSQLQYEVIAGGLISQKELIRHNPDKLAAVLIEVLLRGRMNALRRPAAIRWQTIPRGGIAGGALPGDEARRAKRFRRGL